MSRERRARPTFPTLNAFQSTNAGGNDAFVAKLNPSVSGAASLLYSTYLGGSNDDFGFGVGVDSAGNAYVTGETRSTNFPTLNAFQSAKASSIDAFVTVLNQSGDTLIYSTYLGGSFFNIGNGIAVDSSGNAYVTGLTNSTDFPTLNAFQSTIAGGYDAFVAELNPAASGATSLLYSTYLGGSGNDQGSGIAVDSAGNAYVTGITSSTDFPTLNAYQGSLAGSQNAFVAELSPATPNPTPTATTTATPTATLTLTPTVTLSSTLTATPSPTTTTTATASATTTATSTATTTATPILTTTATPTATSTPTLTATPTPTSAPAGAWPMFHHDLIHSGLSQFSTSANTGTLKWKFAAQFSYNLVDSSPAIGADGTIYIGTTDKNLYAVNPGGTRKWFIGTGGAVDSSPAIGADGTIYAGNTDDNLYAVNSSGTLKWKFLTGNQVTSSPAIGSDGTIYIGSYDHNLYAINPDGTEKWSFATDNIVRSSPAIGSDGTIYVGSEDTYLYAINADGTEKWAFKTIDAVDSSPAIGADGTIYAGSDGLYAANPDGTQKWKFAAGGSISSSPAIGPDGTIYVGCNDDKLYAVTSSGAQKWTFATGNQVQSSPAIGSDGTIYVGSYDHNLYAVNPDGSQRWIFPTGNQVYSSAAIGADGTVYFGSEDHNLYALGAGAGPPPTPTVTATAPVPTPTATLSPTATVSPTATISPTMTTTATPTGPTPTATSTPVPTFSGVFTYHNDNMRTGQNLTETILTPANVNSSNFALLFTDAVDGQIYGQPLYVPNVAIPGQGTHNIVIVATELDSVYAFDADTGGAALWHSNYTNPGAGITAVPATDIGALSVGTWVGITATPVIDPVTGTIYVLSRQKIPGLNISSSCMRSISPPGLSGPTVPSRFPPPIRAPGTGSSGGVMPFNTIFDNDRAALTLANGIVYLAFASPGDVGPYHGWVLGYNTSDLSQAVVWNSTPNGNEGGIWQSDCGPAVDSNGNLYVITGNGTFDTTPPRADWGDSFLRLAPGGGSLSVAELFYSLQ